MTLGTGMFRDGACVATAESVNIFLEVDSRKTIPIPAPVRATLEADPMQEGRADGNGHGNQP
jgi:acyl-CoA thioesterase FadM